MERLRKARLHQETQWRIGLPPDVGRQLLEEGHGQAGHGVGVEREADQYCLRRAEGLGVGGMFAHPVEMQNFMAVPGDGPETLEELRQQNLRIPLLPPGGAVKDGQSHDTPP